MGDMTDDQLDMDARVEASYDPVAREPLAEAVITALDVYGTMGNGEGWTMELDVIGTLWMALTPEERARTGYYVDEMTARIADGLAKREGRS